MVMISLQIVYQYIMSVCKMQPGLIYGVKEKSFLLYYNCNAIKYIILVTFLLLNLNLQLTANCVQRSFWTSSTSPRLLVDGTRFVVSL